MKTLLLPFGVLAMLMLALGTAEAATFTDVRSDTPHAEAISELKAKSVINGYADGTFRPNTLVNRAEFLKMIMLAQGFPQETALMKGSKCFSDFTGTEQWYWAYACAGKDRGIIMGNPDGSFAGTRTVNLAEALAMSVRAWRVTEPRFIREPDNWYDTYMIATQSNTKLFDELPFEPNRTLSRAEAAAVINAFMALPQPVSMCDGHFVGDTYKDDCNTCTCTENGPACTKMACIHEPTCMSSSQCGTGEICTTEDGDCMSPPCPANEPNCMVPAVCMGYCRMK